MKKYRKFRPVEEQPKKKSKKTLYTVIIAGIMILSVIGFTATQSSSQTVKYGSYTFKLEGQKWTAKINNQKFSFYYLPSELSYINSTNIYNLGYIKSVYLTFNPNQKYLQVIDLIRFELAENMFNLEIYPVQAVILNNSLYNLPIITCLNATQFVPVIEFRESEYTEIINQNNCIILNSASESDFIKLKDLLLYKILGVI